MLGNTVTYPTPVSVDVSCYTSDDAQSTHDELGNCRLQACGEVCGGADKESSALEWTPSNGDPDPRVGEHLFWRWTQSRVDP